MKSLGKAFGGGGNEAESERQSNLDLVTGGKKCHFFEPEAAPQTTVGRSYEATRAEREVKKIGL